MVGLQLGSVELKLVQVARKYSFLWISYEARSWWLGCRCTCENPSRCKTCALRPLYKQRAREEPLDEARRPLLAWHMRFQCLADTLSLPCARRGFVRPFFPVLPRLCSIQADMAAEVVLASSGISMPSACAMFLA